MNRTMDAKITKLEREADLKAVVTPTELIPYMQGKKPETEDEGKRIRQIYDVWTARIIQLLGRTKDSAEQLELAQEILKSLPETYRASVMKELAR